MITTSRTCNRVSGASELFTATAGFAGPALSTAGAEVDAPPSRLAFSRAAFSARSRLSAYTDSAMGRAAIAMLAHLDLRPDRRVRFLVLQFLCRPSADFRCVGDSLTPLLPLRFLHRLHRLLQMHILLDLPRILSPYQHSLPLHIATSLVQLFSAVPIVDQLRSPGFRTNPPHSPYSP